MTSPRLLHSALRVALLLLPSGAYDDDSSGRPATDRYGADDDFEGYPVDASDDPYYDSTTEYRPYSPGFNGAFVGGGITGGVLTLDLSGLDEPIVAPIWGAFVQASTAMHVIDVQLAWMNWSGEGTYRGIPTRVDRHTATVTGQLHPLFMNMLRNNRLFYTLANAYFAGGIGADWTDLTPEDAPAFGNFKIGWHIGAGIDIFIDDPDDGSAFWIGFQWRRNLVPSHKDDIGLRRPSMVEHAFLLRLTWRYNGNLLTGFQMPFDPR